MEKSALTNITEKLTQPEKNFVSDLKHLAGEARRQAYRSADHLLVVRNWLIGWRIVTQEQNGKERAKYGKHVIELASQTLTEEYGRGFGLTSIKNMRSFYLMFSKLQTPEHLRKEVSDEMRSLTSDFEKDKLSYLKNPVIAEFLGLPQNPAYSESKQETAIIDHLQTFIMELGKGYAFVARQQHIKTDMGDFYIDLVFYNIILKSYLIIDLKTTQITHQDVGQMDMYVRMYDELKKEEGNNPTIGLVLCSDTSKDLARYSILKDSKQLFAAKYLTYLPTEEELSREIREQKEFFELQKGKNAKDED